MAIGQCARPTRKMFQGESHSSWSSLLVALSRLTSPQRGKFQILNLCCRNVVTQNLHNHSYILFMRHLGVLSPNQPRRLLDCRNVTDKIWLIVIQRRWNSRSLCGLCVLILVVGDLDKAITTQNLGPANCMNQGLDKSTETRPSGSQGTQALWPFVRYSQVLVLVSFCDIKQGLEGGHVLQSSHRLRKRCRFVWGVLDCSFQTQKLCMRFTVNHNCQRATCAESKASAFSFVPNCEQMTTVWCFSTPLIHIEVHFSARRHLRFPKRFVLLPVFSVVWVKEPKRVSCIKDPPLDLHLLSRSIPEHEDQPEQATKFLPVCLRSSYGGSESSGNGPEICTTPETHWGWNHRQWARAFSHVWRDLRVRICAGDMGVCVCVDNMGYWTCPDTTLPLRTIR